MKLFAITICLSFGKYFADMRSQCSSRMTSHIPNRYILRRWRKDFTRTHMRVAVHYDGFACTPAQLRYEDISKGFGWVTDLAADDEVPFRTIMDWIKSQCKDLMTLKSGSKSNSTPHLTTHVTNDCTDLSKSTSESVLDPKLTQRNGTPKKLR